MSEKKIYRLRHKPSGLFFKPGRYRYGKPRITLHKDGKIYTVKPSFKWLTGHFFSNQTGLIKDIIESDWEIVEETIA